jgi:hypothetical protein
MSRQTEIQMELRFIENDLELLRLEYSKYTIAATDGINIDDIEYLADQISIKKHAIKCMDECANKMKQKFALLETLEKERFQLDEKYYKDCEDIVKKLV